MSRKQRERQQRAEHERELTRKEQRLRTRERERHRTLFIVVGITLGLVAAVVLFGIFSEFVMKPRSTVAAVGDDKIITRDFWKRIRFEEVQLQNQWIQYQQLEQQFGDQGLFTNQLSQIQATLANPFSLGTQVLDRMIDELIVAQQAASRGITVDEDTVDETLREEIAAAEGAVTEPHATETAVAAEAATATATSWTPTPTPTIDVSAPITATAIPMPTPEPPPTLPVLDDAQYQQGLQNLADRLDEIAGMDLDEYREIVHARLLADELATVIGEEEVSTTEEQIHARHILLRATTPEPTADPAAEATATPTPLPEEFPTPTATPTPRDGESTKALADELRQRIEAGEDFAALAAEYSDDLSNAQQGGDLGWFGRGQMVAPFEEAAFALDTGEVSEPVETQFGWHLIELLERDDARPKDENILAQERQQAYQDWLLEQRVEADPQRPDDLTAHLPPGLGEDALLPLAGQLPQQQ